MLVTLAFGKLDLEKALVKDATISINRCIWGPDASILGVAFSRTLFRYLLTIAGELRQHLEIDAYVGGVNDIAFAHPNKQLCIVRCGDDKTIKFIFSTLPLMGKIKAWLYDFFESRVDYDALDFGAFAMAYKRWNQVLLFSKPSSGQCLLILLSSSLELYGHKQIQGPIVECILEFQVDVVTTCSVADEQTTHWDDEQMELPPGFRFHPTDKELTTHYLSHKVLVMVYVLEPSEMSI
ncbi:Protein TPR3 [Camellia lanceoleosa]|uniref:Protein TPR3 n=1 Tax=Camellia lanceoleosa TaxID=1840588 RepID=A0ACC0FQ45_9ERIC|nr:Protein TPR3 [Camellia lanceoleosa]